MIDVADFRVQFLDYVRCVCADGDCFPQPAMTCGADGVVEMVALALSPDDVLRAMEKKARDPSVVLLAFGLDRYAKPGQGTTLSNVFTYVVIERGGEPSYGFVEYDGAGDVRQHDLAPGEYWYEIMTDGKLEVVVCHMRAAPVAAE